MVAGNSQSETPDDQPDIEIQRSRPGRIVLTEKGNPDGWIGTDLTVDLKR